MGIVRSVTVDLNPSQVAQVIDVSQYDFGYDLDIRFIDKDDAIMELLETNALDAVIRGTKPSGSAFSISAASISADTARFLLTAEATAEAGDIPMELVFIYDATDDFQVASANFTLRVKKSPYPAVL